MDYDLLFDQIDDIDVDILNVCPATNDDMYEMEEYNETDVEKFLFKIKSGMLLCKTYKDVIYYLGNTHDDYDTIIETINEKTSKYQNVLMETSFGKIGNISKYVCMLYVELSNDSTQKLTIVLSNRESWIDVEMMINGRLFIRSIQ